MNAWFLPWFVISGFCGLVYQVIWLRGAMAAFGVTSVALALCLSTVMAGLALGSYLGGRVAQRLRMRGARALLRLYAAIEAVIALSGLVVWPLLMAGGEVLASTGATWGSATHHGASAAWMAMVLLPFCAAMGATLPVGVAAMGALAPRRTRGAFGDLYAANVGGAMLGVLGAAFVLIELLGFRATGLLAGGFNGLVAISALLVSMTGSVGKARSGGTSSHDALPVTATIPSAASVPPVSATRGLLLVLLFTTGACSLAMEVVWIRQFVPYLGPEVYGFAIVLAVYLLGTLVGAQLYRWTRGDGAGPSQRWRILCAAAFACALLPLLAADPRLNVGQGLLAGALRVAVGIAPFCALLGYLTPLVIDTVCAGEPRAAGAAYALNALGCIIGPLLSCFGLLPWLGEHQILAILASPLLLLALWPSRRAGTSSWASWASWAWPWRVAASAALVAMLLGGALLFWTQTAADRLPRAIVRRDHTATVIAAGAGFERALIINGTGITHLTPLTKMMTHLPLAHLPHAPASALVLCMGMGTSFRSALSWGIDTTVVELVPSVPGLMGYFHDDGPALLRSTRATVVVDDARRFLRRTSERFDVIVVDPPPPMAAAASSLLYSVEFYELAAARLRDGGILQQWLAGNEPAVLAAAAKALGVVFKHVRFFRSLEGWGLHLLGSDRPMARRGPTELATRLPAAAARDLVEWGPADSAAAQFTRVLTREVPQRYLDAQPGAKPLRDDQPVNEYFWLRRTFPPSGRGAAPLGS